MFGFVGRLLGGRIGRAAGGMRPGPVRGRPIAAPDVEPADFAHWVQYYRLTDADLRRLHRRHAVRCYGLFGGALCALGFGATTAFITFGAGLALVDGLLALLFLAGAAGHSLRAWQLRERRLGSFGEWASRPGAWVPSFFSEAK